MKTYILTIATPHGLHIRVAARIVELVRRYDAKVRLFDQDNRQADGDSIMSLMILGATHGDEVRVEVEGRNGQEVAGGLAELFGGRAAV